MADLHTDVGSSKGVATPPVAASDRLRQTIAAVLGVDPSDIDDDSSPDSVATWDSLNHLNLVMAIETEYGISLTAEDAMDMRNVALMRTILKERGITP